LKKDQVIFSNACNPEQAQVHKNSFLMMRINLFCC